ALRVALEVGALVILAMSLTRPPVDASISTAATVTFAVSVTGLAIALLEARTGRAAHLAALPVLWIGAWSVLGIGYLARGWRDRDAVDPWRGLTFLGLASAHVALW